MGNFHISIKENEDITPGAKRPLAPNEESDQKEDDASTQVEIKKLDEREFEKLRDFMMHYNGQHETGIFRIGDNCLSAPNLVGFIGTSDGVSIEILPKIGLAKIDEDTETTRKIFTRMLFSYFRKAWKIDNVPASVHKNMPFPEVLISLYLDELAHLVRRGLARAYVAQEDNLPVFKGKLDLMKQLRHNSIHKERFYVRYDEFTADRPVNRLLKAALQTALQTTKEADNRRKAMQLLPHFDLVKNVQHNWQPEERRIHLQRNIKNYYKKPRNLALLILKEMRPSSWHANEQMYLWLFKMYDVFEAYVTDELLSFAKEHSYEFKKQESTNTLMEEIQNNEDEDKVKFRIQPDMVMRPNANRKNIEGNKAQILVLDTKWKRVDSSAPKNERYGILQSDLYQLYAYGKRYQQEEKAPVCLVLLYPQSKYFEKTIRLKEPNKYTDSELILYLVPVDLHTVLDEKPLCETKKILKEIIDESQMDAVA